MSEQNTKPVIFLAFANDRMVDGQYLRNLGSEADALRDALAPLLTGPNAQWELVERHSTTAVQILDVLREYKDRIAVFHYAGHTDDYNLLLETAEGNKFVSEAHDLAAVLRLQKCPHLVFLNACSTRSQVDDLRNAGVNVVVATSRAVNDRLATTFATQFYQALVDGKGISDAFATAQANTKLIIGDLTRQLRPADPQHDHATGVWPWAVYGDSADLSSEFWTLTLVANDPLSVLPPLPKLDLPETPYRHLEWFRCADAEIFFGRGHEIAELYQRATALDGDPIILFYGQSGVGKSSVLAAGLLPRLAQKQCEPSYKRRDQAKGLTATLADALTTDDVANLSAAWRAAETRTGKPLTVILDQVEELFTRPNPDLPDEMDVFLAALQDIFSKPDLRPQGRLILSFRKEWLAEIETRLKEHELPRAKVFLERLNHGGIVEAITGPARVARLRSHYCLCVADDLPDLIADDLLADPGSPVAPMLQILLTGMWTAAKAQNYDHPCFDRSLYSALLNEKLPTKGLGLADFLARQLDALQAKQPQVVESGLALDLLAYHTTPLGTAEQREITDLEKTYSHQMVVLPNLLQECRDLYLLVDPSANQPNQPPASRLTHDTLAPHVRKRFDESDAPGQRARRILESRTKGGDSTALDGIDLDVVEAGQKGMRTWSTKEVQLVQDSRAEREKHQRRNRLIRTILIGLVVLIAVAAVVAIWQWRVAQKQTSIAQTQTALAKTEAKNAHTAEAQAETERTHAEKEATTILSRYLAEQSSISLDPERNLLLSIEAVKVATEAKVNSAQGNEALRLALAAAPLATLNHEPVDEYAPNIIFNADGSRLATASYDFSDGGTVRLIDNISGQQIVAFQTDKSVKKIIFNTDGSRLAIASNETSKGGTARLVDSVSGRQIAEFQVGDQVEDIIFSPDGSRLAMAGPATVRFVESAGGRLLASLEQESGVERILFSPDGAHLAAVISDTVHIWRSLDGGSVKPLHHATSAWGIDFSPDGSRIATIISNTVQIWDTSNGADVAILKHPEPVREVKFGLDGSRLVVTSGRLFDEWYVNLAFYLWDIPSKRELKTITYGNHYGYSVFSPDHTRLIVITGDNLLHLLDAREGKELAVYEYHFSPYVQPQFNSTSDRLAVIVSDTVRLVDTINGREVATIQHGEQIEDIEFSRNSTLLALAGTGGKARLVNGKDGTEVALFLHAKRVASVAFSPDSRRLVTFTGEEHGNTLHLWDIESKTEKKGFEYGYSLRDFEFSPDSSRLAFAADDISTVQLWDSMSGQELARFRHVGVRRIFFSPDSSRLATGSEDGMVRLWDSTGASEPVTYKLHEVIREVYPRGDDSRMSTDGKDGKVYLRKIPSGKEFANYQLANPGDLAIFSADGSRLITSGNVASHGKGIVRLLDTANGKILTSLDTDYGVRLVRFSADGTRVVLWNSVSTYVYLWDSLLGKKLTEFFGAFNNVDFNLHNSRLALVGEGAYLIDSTSGQKLVVLEHNGTVNDVDFNHDGSQLATASNDNTVRLWDGVTGQALGVLWHGVPVKRVIFSDNDNRVATVTADFAVHIWDSVSRKELTVLHHTRNIGTVYFSPQGSQLAVSGAGVVDLWDSLNGEKLGVLYTGGWPAPSGFIFNADGSRLYTINIDGTIQTWRTNTDELVRASCRALSRNLTQEEWELYFGKDTPYRRTCENLPIHWSVVTTLLTQGHSLVRNGQIEDALGRFRNALDLDPNLSHLSEAVTLNPEELKAEANLKEFGPNIRAEELAAQTLIDWGISLVKKDKLEEANIQFQKAHELAPEIESRAVRAQLVSGQQLVQSGAYIESMTAFATMQTISPTFAITKVLSANEWNRICWNGSRFGDAVVVLPACERAVALEPEDGNIRDSRGLARACTGNMEGAIADFEFAAQWARKRNYGEEFISSREAWITTLKARKNPFDSATLGNLRQK